MTKHSNVSHNKKSLPLVKKQNLQGKLTSGFTLIEIGIVLVIIAVLMGTFYGYNSGRDDVAKRRQTLAKMEIIEKALAQYVAENNRLPCPAVASLTTGVGDCTSTAHFSYINPVPTNYASSYNQPYATGLSVPYPALKLPASMTIDAWGNRFDYIITKMFGDTGYPATFEMTNMGGIIINDATGAQITNQAAYVLISHGPNKLGAVNPLGNLTSLPADVNEIRNSKIVDYGVGSYSNPPPTYSGYANISDFTFVASEPYYTSIGTTTNTSRLIASGSTTSYFDDIVHWKTKWQIIREAGSLLSNSTCTLAYTVLTKQDNTFNTLYYNYYCNGTSNKPANAMCSFILNSLATKVSDLCLNKVS